MYLPLSRFDLGERMVHFPVAGGRIDERGVLTEIHTNLVVGREFEVGRLGSGRSLALT